MNREIKFRGKASRKDKDMWLYGDLIKIGDNYHILEKDDMIEDGHHITQDSDRPTWVEEETIGQFTGLLDRNGKEIYEGDIVSYVITTGGIAAGNFVVHVRHLVSYDVKHAAFNIGYHYACAGTMREVVDANNLTVIGNIHDNPELIKD